MFPTRRPQRTRHLPARYRYWSILGMDLWNQSTARTCTPNVKHRHTNPAPTTLLNLEDFVELYTSSQEFWILELWILTQIQWKCKEIYKVADVTFWVLELESARSNDFREEDATTIVTSQQCILRILLVHRNQTLKFHWICRVQISNLRNPMTGYAESKYPTSEIQWLDMPSSNVQPQKSSQSSSQFIWKHQESVRFCESQIEEISIGCTDSTQSCLDQI